MVSLSQRGTTASSRRWDAETGGEVIEIKPAGPPVNHFKTDQHISTLAVSPDGRKAVVFNYAKTLLVYDLVTKQQVQSLPVSTGWLSSLQFLNDGRTLAWY